MEPTHRTSPPAVPRTRFRVAHWLGLLLVVLLTALVVQWRSANKILYGDNFLREDESVSFLVTDVLLHGGALYKDVAYPYGYIPAYLHAAAARLSGNTIATYMHLFLAIDVAVLGMLYLLLRKVLRPWAATLFAVGVMIPQTISPGAVCGDNISNMAYPLEKIPLLAVALLWREPRRQPWWRALLIGACLGGMQGIKFGTGLVAGLALASVEFFSWYQAGFSAEARRVALRNNLAALGGFLLVQGALVAVTVASLPPALARDVLWPTYMYANYAAFENRHFPGWYSLNYFIGVELIPFLGVVGSLWWLGVQVRRRRSPAPMEALPMEPGSRGGGILLLVVFYALASFILFKGSWHFFSFVWIPVLGGVYLFLQPLRVVRWAVVAFWGAGFARFLLLYLAPATPLLVPLALDNGERLWVSPVNRKEITGLVACLRTPPPGTERGKRLPVVFYPLGAGYHVFFHVPRGGRNSWYAPGLVRPYDVALIEELARTARWVVRPFLSVGQLTPDPVDWDRADGLLRNTFDPPLAKKIGSQLRLERKIEANAWVFSQPP